MRPILRIARDWAVRCFGKEHVSDASVRSLRIAEEAVELAQSVGVAKDKMLLLVETIYSRPRGHVDQEVGGVLMTVYLFCVAILGRDPDEVFAQELSRVLAKSPEHFAQRNQEKLDLGLKG